LPAPTPPARVLPPTGSGGDGSFPWTGIASLVVALALAGLILLCAGLWQDARHAEPPISGADEPERPGRQVLAALRASLERLARERYRARYDDSQEQDGER
jgi:hypothetical protein